MPAPWLVTKPPTQTRTKVADAVKTANRFKPKFLFSIKLTFN
jgi:hypothetical protein